MPIAPAKMFSVPGWNLSAPLKTQIEQPKPKNPAHEGKKSQKRKRKREAAEQEQVNEDNVGDLWGKVIEGKVQEQRKQTEALADAIAGADNDGDVVGEVATEEPSSKKRRKRNKKNKASEEVIADAAEADEQEDGAAVPVLAQNELTESELSKKKHKNKRRKEQRERKAQDTGDDATSTSKPAAAAVLPTAPVPAQLPPGQKLTPLQQSMRQKLTSARFRHLNESLYTKPSAESLSIFKDSPEMFEDYHAGFAQQVTTWPENPVDSYYNEMLRRGKPRSKGTSKDKKYQNKKHKGKPVGEPEPEPTQGKDGLKPLPRNMRGHCTIADLGCGTASLSLRLQPHLKPLSLTMHAFDLSKPSDPATGPLVTVADISNLPLPDGSVDVAIFCLALMGTNWLDFIDESYRILRWRGELWVSEIKSRFGRVERRKGGQRQIPINSVGSLNKAKLRAKAKSKKSGNGSEITEKEEGIQNSDDEQELSQAVDGASGKEGTDVSAFLDVLKKRGFVLDALPERPGDAIDLSNKMFVKMRFVKGVQPTRGKNVGKEEEGGGVKGRGKLGMGMKGKKYAAVSADDEGDDDKDAKVLKPCLYKIR